MKSKYILPETWDAKNENILLGKLFPDGTVPELPQVSTTGKAQKSFAEISAREWEGIGGVSPFEEKKENICGDFNAGFYTGGIDFEKLSNDIQRAGSLDHFFFDYRKYGLEDEKTVSFQGTSMASASTTPHYEPFEYRDETGKKKEAYFKTSWLNRRICYVRDYNVGINFDDGQMLYTVNYPYEGAENKKTASDISAQTSINDFGRLNNFVAISLSTDSYEAFIGYILKIYGNKNVEQVKNLIKYYFDFYFNKYDDSVKMLKALYEAAPDFVLKGKPKDTLLRHLRLLIEYDDTGFLSGWRDSSSAVLKIIRNCEKKMLYDWFLKYPETLLRIYRDLDGEQKEDLSGVAVSSKDIFCLILLTLCDRSAAPLARYTIGGGFSVRSDIDDQGVNNWLPSHWSDKPKENLTLQQFKTDSITPITMSSPTTMITTTTSGSAVVPDGDALSFHPLDMVALVDAETGTSQVVPAIYVKMLADRQRWADILKLLTICALTVVILLSFGTATAEGASALAILTASVDGTVALGDLILTLLPDSEAKKWFLKYWSPLSVLVSGGLSLGALSEGLLKNGPRLLGTVSAETAETNKLVNFLRDAYALAEIEVTVNGAKKIVRIEAFTEEFANTFGKKISKQMQDSGVFLTEQMEDGRRLLIFDGSEFAGSHDQIRKILRSASNDFKDKTFMESVKASVKNAVKLSDDGLALLKNEADIARLTIDGPMRPVVVSIIEGTVKGEVIRTIGYSKNARQMIQHPVIKYWVEHPYEFVENGRELMIKSHGFCAEIEATSKFLYRAEEILGISAGSMEMKTAEEILFNSTSQARTVVGKKVPMHRHNQFLKACPSCEKMLETFNIKEIKPK